MDIYLATAFFTNFTPIGKTEGKSNMDIYLAGSETRPYVFDHGKFNFRLLESFFYCKEFPIEVVPKLKGFMLDSGAFTYMQGNTKADIDKYCDAYIEYIKAHNIELFFELDVDSIYGYDKALELRRRIESRVGRPCIPVWHRSRGKQAFIDMCKAYDYVAIGGIVSKEITMKEYKYLPWFVKTAHEHGAKIHGLGFTNLKWLKLIHFDSVDSSSWTSGNRFGHLYRFDGRTLKQLGKDKGRIKKGLAKEAAINNFVEWVKFANYAERSL